MHTFRTCATAMASALIVLLSSACAESGKARPAPSGARPDTRPLPPEPAVTYSGGAGAERVEHGELILDVGNAGAFEWTLNGRPGQALGREGRRRQITITRENAATFVR